MNDLLTIILKNITTKPDAVQISMDTEGDVDVYTIKVDPEDVGRVIGKSGKVIRAIRSLAHVSAVQQQKRVRIHLDDGGPQETVAPQAELNQAATEIVEPVEPEVAKAPTVAPKLTPEPVIEEEAPEVEIEAEPVEAVTEAPEITPEVTPEVAPEVTEESTSVEDLLPEEPAK